VRLISARWVFPISIPPIREGAVVLDDDPFGERGDDGAPSKSAQDAGRGPGPAGHARIVAMGTRADLRRAHPGLAEERAHGALLPSLVNAHCHLELSSLGGQVPGGDGLVNWTRRLARRLTDLDPQSVFDAAFTAAASARAFGTGAMADVGNGVAGWQSLGRLGLRGVFFHELVGSREARTGDAIADAASERATVPESERPASIPAVPAPHAPYSVGPALLRRIFATAASSGLCTTIHLAEDPDELRLLRDGAGAWTDVLRALGVDPAERSPRLSPTAYLESLGAFNAAHAPLLVHMVHATAEDRARARTAGATAVLCPRSNLHIGGRLPDVPSFVADGVALAIGTDSLASTPSLSLWEELATLAAQFPDVAPAVWLRAGTAGGAAALNLLGMGSLQPGKRPGLLDVSLADAVATSLDDPERALVENPHPTVHWMSPEMPDGMPRGTADRGSAGTTLETGRIPRHLTEQST
jgi:cytosine/adenosine deaminase-related metal-dependent hydrolase